MALAPLANILKNKLDISYILYFFDFLVFKHFSIFSPYEVYICIPMYPRCIYKRKNCRTKGLGLYEIRSHGFITILRRHCNHNPTFNSLTGVFSSPAFKLIDSCRTDEILFLY